MSILGRVLTALVATVLSMVPVVAAQNLTAADLVARNLRAKGGLDKVKTVTSLKQVGRVTLQGRDATMTIYLRRQEIAVAGQTIVNGFDGTTAWLVNPLSGSTVPMVISGPDADATKEQSDFDGPLVDSQAKGYTIDLVGAETLNGRPVQHLKITDRRQHVQHCYLDGDTALEAKIVSDMPGAAIEQELSDWREVEGITLPFSLRTSVGGRVVQQLVIQTVEVNVPLDDALFRMPVRSAGRF
jgi:hypothetical protein